jgi:hypothetical protein
VSAERRAAVPDLSCIAALAKDADRLARELGWPDASLRHAYHRQLMMLLSQAYVQVFGTQPENPDWVPHTGALFPWGAPNHDTIYGFAPLDAEGTYRISGMLGTETVASLMFRHGGANTGQMHGATLGEIDMTAIEATPDGRFSLLLGRTGPERAAEPWYAIPEGTTGVLARHVTETPGQRDGVWTLQRLDRVPGSGVPDENDVAVRMARMTGFVRQLNEFLLRLVKRLRDQGHVNAFVGERFQGQGGIAAQMYYQGLFELEPDEALILESELPESINYWSVQIVDPFYSAIDFIFHSAAFNGRQARVSADGKVRFVLSTQDPAVPNWLDPSGWRQGAMLWRWHAGSTSPHPQVTRVKLADLRAKLPRDTPVVSETERAAERAVRIAHYQARRRL